MANLSDVFKKFEKEANAEAEISQLKADFSKAKIALEMALRQNIYERLSFCAECFDERYHHSESRLIYEAVEDKFRANSLDVLWRLHFALKEEAEREESDDSVEVETAR